jgi:hypothetical protein
MRLYRKKMYPSSEELIGIATKVDGRRSYFLNLILYLKVIIR